MDSIDRHPVTVQQGLAEKYATQADDARKHRPFHRSPLLWGGAALAGAAIAVYIFTDALAWQPRIH
jgi:hypothetical protein